MFFNKVINRQRNVKHFTIEINWRSQKGQVQLRDKYISRKENSKKCTRFEEQKFASLFEETFILSLLSSAVFRLQNRVSDFFQFVLLRR